MSIVYLLTQFVTRELQFGAVRDDDVVSAVCCRRVDGFVLAYEDARDAGCESAENCF